jgi:uncharacterized protein YdaL
MVVSPRGDVMSLHKRLTVLLALTLVAVFGVLTVPSSSSADGLLIYSTSASGGASASPTAQGGDAYSGEDASPNLTPLDRQIIAVRILDSLVGQVRRDYTVVEDTDIDSETLGDYDYVIYFGAGRKQLSTVFVDAINNYEGPFYAFNENAGQFTTKLRWLTVRGRTVIDGVGGALRGRGARARDAPIEPPPGRGQELADAIDAIDVRGQGARVTLSGRKVDDRSSIPLALHAGDDYYFAGAYFYPPLDGYVTESLLDFFGEEGTGLTKYLRLEDVHPLSDPRHLMEQAKWLKDQGIPYMVALIPVYQYGDGRMVHLDESPDVEEALQYMQDNGGTMVMHGYKHKFRAEETGEGFEFWDAEHDRPIYQPEEETPRFRSDFTTEQEWNEFVQAGEQFERSYMRDRIRRGVEELVAHRLYPLGFEPPHYAISQQGYRVLSEHFSSYVGKLQMSDATWQTGYGPPDESRPTFLHGMTAYPESLGFVEQGAEEASLEQMQAELESRSQFNQAYLSAFYHPYLGLDGLKRVVEVLNQVPGTWLDLKHRRNRVQVGNIRISTDNGEIRVDKPFWASAYERSLWIRRHAGWAVPGILALLTAGGFLVIRREMRQKV